MLRPTPAQRKRVTDQFGCACKGASAFGRRPHNITNATQTIIPTSMQPTTAMKVHTPSSYLARTSRDSSAGVFGSIAQVNMYRPDPSKGLPTQNHVPVEISGPPAQD